MAYFFRAPLNAPLGHLSVLHIFSWKITGDICICRNLWASFVRVRYLTHLISHSTFTLISTTQLTKHAHQTKLQTNLCRGIPYPGMHVPKRWNISYHISFSTLEHLYIKNYFQEYTEHVCSNHIPSFFHQPFKYLCANLPVPVKWSWFGFVSTTACQDALNDKHTLKESLFSLKSRCKKTHEIYDTQSKWYQILSNC